MLVVAVLTGAVRSSRRCSTRATRSRSGSGAAAGDVRGGGVRDGRRRSRQPPWIDTVALVPLLFGGAHRRVGIGLIAALPLIAVADRRADHRLSAGAQRWPVGQPRARHQRVGDRPRCCSHRVSRSSSRWAGSSTCSWRCRHVRTCAGRGLAFADAPVAHTRGRCSSGFELAAACRDAGSGVGLDGARAMAFIMKTMPQINIMSMGFADPDRDGVVAMLTLLLRSSSRSPTP